VPCIAGAIVNQSANGQLHQAVASLELLTRKGIRLPCQALSFILKKCAEAKSLKLGKWVHLHLKVTGLKRPNAVLCNNLIYMYSECRDHIGARKVFDKMSHKNLYSWNHMLSGYAKLGMLKPARKLFDKMPQKDVVSWNTMVIGYAKAGVCGEGLKCYKELRRDGIGCNEYTFSGLMMICVKVRDIRLTMQAHRQVLGAGFLSNVVVSCSVLDAYAKCSGMKFASRLFDEMRVKDVLSWTTMVSGFAQCGDMESASKVFNTMPVKNPISWTSLIAGYARNGQGHKAFELFTKMMRFRVSPDQFTFSSVLCACASLASLKHGKQVHGHLLRIDFRPNTIVVSSLIDMYSKCGNLDAGRLVFDITDVTKDAVLWNTMLSALAQHGRGEEAIRMLNEMVSSGVAPNRITLVILLNACSHSGLVEEGLRVFESMTMVDGHGIVPDDEHYACLIDLLGRGGDFENLANQLRMLPCEPSERIWNSLLGVCSIHGNMELGKMAAGQLMKMQPGSPAAHLLLSSVYGELGRWDLVEKVREVMERRQVRKEQGLSWIEKGSSLQQTSMAAAEEEEEEEAF
ncbi:Pentatricopeptide repeat-containing protein At2g21090, partial [Linum perenne]